MNVEPVGDLTASYFARHKYRAASSLNPLGIQLWEANGFGKREEASEEAENHHKNKRGGT